MEIINHVELRNGTGYIKGTNIKAEMVARQHIMEQSSVDELTQQYGLSSAEVHSAIVFYLDNQELLDTQYTQALELAKQHGTSFDDFKAKIEARRVSGSE